MLEVYFFPVQYNMEAKMVRSENTKYNVRMYSSSFTLVFRAVKKNGTKNLGCPVLHNGQG